MTPIEIDPVGPVGPMGSGSPRGRRPKPSGAAQAIWMILAWVGGAGAAVAVAFWILQYVKPAPDPVQVVNDRPNVPKRDDQINKPTRPNKPKKIKPKSKVKPVEPEPVKQLIDLKNFQRPEMPGLAYRYYEGESFGMSDFSAAAPSRSGVLVDIGDLPAAKESKGLRLEGFWETKTDQPCEFLLDSTNGARLYIDDQLVLDNTDQFKREPVEASRTIEPGKHDVQIDFILSAERGSYKLEVGGVGDPQRMDLTRLLQPFESEKLKSLESLQYELAKYPQPAFAVKPLVASNLKAVESGFIEAVSDASVNDGENVENKMPEDGKLLAGLAISPNNGQVAAVLPIYLDDTGLSMGESIGKKSGQWQVLIAKSGFAVSAVQIGESELAEDVSMEFMKIDNESLLPTGAYKQSFGGEPVEISVSDKRQPVIGLRTRMSADSSLLGIDAIRTSSGGGRILTILVDGFPKPLGVKETPSPSEVAKRMKKLMKESASQLKGKAGTELQMELKALAQSTASTARSNADDEARFIGLLEARRLHLLGGEFRSAFAIIDELSQEFEYDYWDDLMLFFEDAVKMAGKNPSMQRQVVAEIEPAIVKAEEQFEFEVAGKLATGGKSLATALEDQILFGKFNQQLAGFEQNAKATKQARAAAKTLASRPDDAKANRVMGIFSLVVTQDWSEAMKYFSISANKDCEFIAMHDRSYDGSDAEIAIELADCWKRIGKKNDELEKVAFERARKVLTEAKERAQGKALKTIEADLERL